MGRAVIFLPAAQRDVAEAHAYYESHTEGLGADFLWRIEAATHRISTQPLSCRVVVDEFRRVLIRRFPYVLFYEVTEAALLVHAVFHCARNPADLNVRLRKH